MPVKKSNTRRGNGEGSIVKIKDKITDKLIHFKGVLCVGRDDDGKLIRKQFYGKTQKEVVGKMNDYRNKSASGLMTYDDKITLQQWFKTWLYDYRVNDLRPASLSRYDVVYKIYILSSQIGGIKLKNLRAANIQAYYNYLMNKESKSAYTIRSINKPLKCALNQAVKENYITINCCNNVILPKLPAKDEIQIFTVTEQTQFIKSLKDHRNRALFILVLGTGLRIGEVLGLKWSDINFDIGELTVNRSFRRVTKFGDNITGSKTAVIEQEPKTKNSIRTIPMPSNVLAELQKHNTRQLKEILKAGSGYVKNDLVFPTEIGEPTDAGNLRRSYSRALKKANVPYRKFHALRHTYATRLFENDVPLKTVQILLGHSNIKTTADIYTHVMPKEKIKAVEKLNSLFII